MFNAAHSLNDQIPLLLSYVLTFLIFILYYIKHFCLVFLNPADITLSQHSGCFPCSRALNVTFLRAGVAELIQTVVNVFGHTVGQQLAVSL